MHTCVCINIHTCLYVNRPPQDEPLGSKHYMHFTLPFTRIHFDRRPQDERTPWARNTPCIHTRIIPFISSFPSHPGRPPQDEPLLHPLLHQQHGGCHAGHGHRLHGPQLPHLNRLRLRKLLHPHVSRLVSLARLWKLLRPHVSRLAS